MRIISNIYSHATSTLTKSHLIILIFILSSLDGIECRFPRFVRKREVLGAETDLSMSMEGATCPERRDMQQLAFARDPNLVTVVKWRCSIDDKYSRYLCGSFDCFCADELTGELKYKTTRSSQCSPEFDRCDGVCAVDQTRSKRYDGIRSKRLSHTSSNNDQCTPFKEPLCASNKKLYSNPCEFECAECKSGKNFTILHQDECHPYFIGTMRAMPGCLEEKSIQERLNRHKSRNKPSPLIMFDCDDEGYFKLKQCDGSTCICVNKLSGFPEPTLDPATECLGEKLSPDTTLNITGENCEYRKKQQRLLLITDMDIDIVVLWDCDADGNYLPRLCGSEVCYCINQETGEVDWNTANEDESVCKEKDWSSDAMQNIGASLARQEPEHEHIERFDESICHLPPRTGPCSSSYIAFYYEPSTDDCQSFMYGGCNPNGNNFITKTLCMQACAMQK